MTFAADLPVLRERSATLKPLYRFVAFSYILTGILTVAAWLLGHAGLLRVHDRTTSLTLLVKNLFAKPKGMDSWRPMLAAIHAHDAGRPIYDSVFFADHIKFQYPVTSLIPMYLLHSAGWSDTSIVTLIYCASWLSFGLIAWITIAILARGVGSPDPVGTSAVSIQSAALIVLTALTFYPLTWPMVGGQIQIFVTALFALTVWFWINKLDWPAGIMVGLMALMKPQMGLLVVWFILRKKFGAFWASTSVIAAGLVAAGFIFGWREHLRYLDVLAFMSKHGETYYQNYSVNGLLNRFFLNGYNLDFQDHSFPEALPAVYLSTIVTSALLLGTALVYPLFCDLRGGIVDFSIMAIAATAASPIAWPHHYGILFPIFAILAAAIIRGQIASKRDIACLAVACLLISNNWSPFNIWAGNPALNWLQSLPLFGVFLLLAVLLRRCGQSSHASAPVGETYTELCQTSY